MNTKFLMLVMAGLCTFSGAVWAGETKVCTISYEGEVSTLVYESSLDGEITLTEDDIYTSTCEEINPQAIADEILVEETDRVLFCRDGLVMTMTVFSEKGDRYIVGDDELPLSCE